MGHLGAVIEWPDTPSTASSDARSGHSAAQPDYRFHVALSTGSGTLQSDSQVAGACGFAGGTTQAPGATTASVPRGLRHAIRTAPSPSRTTTSFTHGPTTGREER